MLYITIKVKKDSKLKCYFPISNINTLQLMQMQ